MRKCVKLGDKLIKIILIVKKHENFIEFAAGKGISSNRGLFKENGCFS